MSGTKCIVMLRPWFEAGPCKTSLEEKVVEGWYVSVNDGAVVGKVVRLIYAGYKVELQDGTQCTVSPLNDNIVTIAPELVEQELQAWSERHAAIVEHKRQVEQKQQEEHARLMEQQAKCLHDKISTERVVRAAGCDIDDTTCDLCGKRLRRSWSTAYERDPDDLIADWEWWVRYCRQTYQQEPSRQGYEVVTSIASMY